MIISKKVLHYRPFYIGLFRTLIYPLIGTIALTACDNTDTLANSPHNVRKSTHRVELVTVENRAVSLTQTVSGTLEAQSKIRLYNEESGRLTRLPFYEGDYVKKGTLLAQLDNELLKTDVAKATANKEQEKLDLSRLKKLLPKKISTEEEVARARTELDLAIAEEKRQLTRLQRTSIKAPINGLITRRLYEPGDMLAAQSHIITIIDPKSLLLKANLAERWLPLVKKGQKVTLYIDALGDKAFTASVIRIHPTIDASTHKGKIEILLQPVPERATAGQFTRAEIKLTATDRLILPIHTVHYEPEGAYVFRVAKDEEGNMIANKVFFEVGQQFASVVEVDSGLSAGDTIVSRGYLGLRDGKKVDVALPAEQVTNTDK